MATFGSVTSENTIPNAGFAFQGLNVNTQAWSTFTMPTPGGRVITLHVYFDADVTAGNGFLVMWVGSVPVASATTDVAVNNIPVGSQSAGGQAWHHANLSGNGFYVKGGSTVSLGMWMPGSSGFIISSISGGSSLWNGVGFSSPGGQGNNGSTGIGTMGVFADYIPCLRKIRTNSGTWIESPKQMRLSNGTWTIGPRWRRNTSGVWIQVQ